MRKSYLTLIAVAAAGILASGCAGPEQKLGRGLRNLAEPIRMGEMQRSIEQTRTWDGKHYATTGFIRGFNRTVARTAIGAWETATFLIPTKADGTYGPIFTPKAPLYPDISIRNYKEPWGGMALTEDPIYADAFTPGLPESTIMETDTHLNFSAGDVAPWFPGSRFSIFNNN